MHVNCNKYILYNFWCIIFLCRSSWITIVH